MDLSATVSIPTQVMAREVGDETVILDLASGTYFGLDHAGARIWQLLGDGKTLDEMCNLMMAEYEVSRPQIESDLIALLGELHRHGLVTVAKKHGPR